MRPIDAENLKKDISKYRKSLKPEYIVKLTDAMLKDIEDIVSEQPSVDAVEVIRCRNCKYCEMNKHGFVFYCSRLKTGTNENEYCSSGKLWK
jgi:hypothetical protein